MPNQYQRLSGEQAQAFHQQGDMLAARLQVVGLILDQE